MSRRAHYGTDAASAAAQHLTVGAVQATLQDGHLRHLHVDGIEVIRDVAFLVRDRDWGTVTAQSDGVRIQRTAEWLHVSWQARYDMDGQVTAVIALDLTADGMDLTATAHSRGEVWTNRTGITVLHPIIGVAGAPVAVDHPDGRRTMGRFPDLIDPWQPFMDIAALTHRAGPWNVTFHMSGDVFEMEDQRQWGDASFKTYNRPLALPWPYRLSEAEPVVQSVSIRWHRQSGEQPAAVKMQGVPNPRFPQTALLVTAAQARRAASAPRMLQRIAPQRLLCHVDAGTGPIDDDLRAYAALQALCSGIAYDLELIAACPPESDLDNEFAAYAAAVKRSGLRASSVMVVPQVDRSSVPPGSDWPDCPALADIYAAARLAFPGLPLGGGSATFFPELNRKRPPVGQLDFIAHGLCPIVHAADDIAVMETLQAVPQILTSGTAIAAGAAYRLGPSTLAMRHNPYGARTIPNPDRLRLCMADDDPRQDGAFAAAWTCGLAVAIAQAGLEVWTPAELYGPRGLIDDTDSPRPVADVVTALAALAGQQVGHTRIADGLDVMEIGEAHLIANLSPDPAPAQVGDALPGYGWRFQ